MRNGFVNRLFKADTVEESYYGYKASLAGSPDAVADILTLPAGLRAAAAFFCFFDDFAFIKIITYEIPFISYYPIDL